MLILAGIVEALEGKKFRKVKKNSKTTDDDRVERVDQNPTE